MRYCRNYWYRILLPILYVYVVNKLIWEEYVIIHIDCFIITMKITQSSKSAIALWII